MTDQPETFQRVSVADAARLLGVSVATVRRRIRAGELEAEMIIRPQGTAFVVRLPLDASAGVSDAYDRDQEPRDTMRTQASPEHAVTAMVQATIATVLAPLMAEQGALRPALDWPTAPKAWPVPLVEPPYTPAPDPLRPSTPVPLPLKSGPPPALDEPRTPMPPAIAKPWAPTPPSVVPCTPVLFAGPLRPRPEPPTFEPLLNSQPPATPTTPVAVLPVPPVAWPRTPAPACVSPITPTAESDGGALPRTTLLVTEKAVAEARLSLCR